jgi:hypothetical protein
MGYLKLEMCLEDEEDMVILFFYFYLYSLEMMFVYGHLL